MPREAPVTSAIRSARGSGIDALSSFRQCRQVYAVCAGLTATQTSLRSLRRLDGVARAGTHNPGTWEFQMMVGFDAGQRAACAPEVTLRINSPRPAATIGVAMSPARFG